MIFCCGTLRLFDATALSFIRIRKVVNESKKYKGRPCMYRHLWSRKVADIVIAMHQYLISPQTRRNEFYIDHQCERVTVESIWFTCRPWLIRAIHMTDEEIRFTKTVRFRFRQKRYYYGMILAYCLTRVPLSKSILGSYVHFIWK